MFLIPNSTNARLRLGGIPWVRVAGGGSLLLVYAVEGFTPELVLDFQEDKYFLSSTSTTLDAATTYTGASLSTMTDSDGLLKWAPHNLLTHSEEKPPSGWAFTDDTNTTSVELANGLGGVQFVGTGATNCRMREIFTFPSPGNYTLAVYVDPASTYTGTALQAGALTGSSGDKIASASEADGSGLISCTFTVDAADLTASIDIGILTVSSNTLILGGWHIYRSDLGGMVDNPVTGNSYVPTTTAAVYLPRVGNHVYNGTTWINEGLLLESEARTNLLLNSATLSTQSTTVTAVPHTLHFTGTGTITLTGASTVGPLVGTGTGENNRVSLVFTPSAATLTMTVSGTVTNGQLEVGSTLSSYIPTAGAEATRAAQTLEIAGADMPDYQTITYAGADLVTNGEFATDTGWDKGAGWTISGGTANVVGDNGRIVQTNLVASGPTKLLEVSWDQVITSGTRFRVFPRNAANSGQTGVVLTSGSATGGATYGSGNCRGSGTFTVYVTTTGGFSLQFLAEPGNSGTIDNVVVREINPLAVSIAIDGKVTGGTSQFVKWSANASNEILIDAASSTYTFSQEAATVVDTVVGGSFTSGINVPFLLSSRHGSTFLNGATDGTALTANTTPIAIADLSAAAFQIGSTFMGTISKLRVWPVDITDAGIEEAST